MSEKKSILTIIVTYNRLNLLKECLKGVLNQEEENDILIIDNKSTDGTADFLKKENYKNLKVITTEKNIGGAGGFNLGVKYAIEHNYQYAWLMDDDTIPDVQALKELVKVKNNLSDEFSFLCSYVKWTDGNICKMNVPNVKKEFLKTQDYNLLVSGILEVDRCSFVSCFINLKKVKDYGLPIKDFFIYYDDAEYTRRISRDLPAYLSLKSVVLHKMKNNTNTRVEDLEDLNKIERIRLDYRNGYKFCKSQGAKTVIRYNVRYFYHVFKVLVSKKPYKWKKIKEMTIGMINGTFFNPKIEYIKNKEDENEI